MAIRRRVGSPPQSPFRAFAHHQIQSGASSASNSSESVSSLLYSFNVESNPSRPVRPSPLAASAVPDIPLELLDRIRSFPLFLSAPDSFITTISSHLRPQIHAAHDTILTEGDDAVAMYWLVRGAVAVTSRDGEAVYAELKPGSFFGEIGLMMDVARTATVVARTKCLLVVLKKEALRAVLPAYPEMEKAIRQEAEERLVILKKKQTERGGSSAHQQFQSGEYRAREAAPGQVSTGESGNLKHTPANVNPRKRKSPSPSILENPVTGGSALGSGYVNVRATLKELPLFAELPADTLHFLGLSAQPKLYPPFADIVRKGAPGNDLFFIVNGEAEVILDDEVVHGLPKTTMVRPRLKPGQYFGEVASLGLSPGRTATVRSITKVECLMIPGTSLQELWKRCPPGVRDDIEDTAKRRLPKPDGDVVMRGALLPDSQPPGQRSKPADIVPPKVVFTAPSKPSSPVTEEAASRIPIDPDPFLSVDMEILRSRRRSSLAPPLPVYEGHSQVIGVRNYHTLDSSPLKQPPYSAPSSPPHTEWDGPKKKARTITRNKTAECKRTLPHELLVRVFQQFDIAELMRLRQVCTDWRRLLSESDKLCAHIDLATYHRCVTDKVIVDVLAPFIRNRPKSIDISDSFHITDEGFQVLWKQCGKNVTSWRMRSVWEVSAGQLLEMSDQSKQLEELDWSNCRKVGDILLGRVVGWVVPTPAGERTSSVVISRQASGKRTSKSPVKQAASQPDSNSPPPPGTVIGCPKLSRLNLSYCKHITDRSMAHLAAHASARLQSLSLTRCTSISDAGFQSWAPFQFPKLTHLCLADCTYLSDKAIVALVNSAKSLTHLDLSFCCALSDTATEVVALGLPRLQELRLAFCGSAVSDASLGGIALHLNDLRGLSVRGCVRVTGVGIENVLEGCGRIEWIDVSQCKNLAGWLGGGGVSRWGVDAAGGLVKAETKAVQPQVQPDIAVGRNGGSIRSTAGIGRMGGPGPIMKAVVLPKGVRAKRTRKPVKFILQKGEGLR